jgi:tetratricopeptide (TPR) repeat protein
MANKGNSSVGRLRKRVERALAGGARNQDIVRDLETLVRTAGEGHRDALFAHRQLAELRLADSPWCAALHLRKLVLAESADDSVFALLGLCHAMLGNFVSAIGAYKRAIELAPRNPWYHHNLGHLLDVGVGNSSGALHHLRLAHEIEPEEDEICASLAHCCARVGRIDEAKDLARLAVRCAPRNIDHRALLDWLERGAPGTRTKGRNRASERRQTSNKIARVRRDDVRDPVAHLLATHMPGAGFSSDHVRCAHALWGDFCSRRELNVAKPSVYAAAIAYAVAQVHMVRTVTQTTLGRCYGVTPASISGRYAEVRSALALVPGDPRYSQAR